MFNKSQIVRLVACIVKLMTFTVDQLHAERTAWNARPQPPHQAEARTIPRMRRAFRRYHYVRRASLRSGY